MSVRDILVFRLRYGTNVFNVEFSVGPAPEGFEDLYSSSLDYGKWHHFAAVYDTEKVSMFFYIDGCLNAKTRYASAPTWQTSGQYLMCGKYQSEVHQNFYKGGMDELLIFRRSLNPLEIAELANKEIFIDISIDTTICEGRSFGKYSEPGKYLDGSSLKAVDGS
jgi:Concanavalin A-like lectin/glucanases superfamily